MEVVVCDRCLRIVSYDLVPVTVMVGGDVVNMGMCEECARVFKSLQKKHHFDGTPMAKKIRGVMGVAKPKKKSEKPKPKEAPKTKAKAEKPTVVVKDPPRKKRKESPPSSEGLTPPPKPVVPTI